MYCIIEQPHKFILEHSKITKTTTKKGNTKEFLPEMRVTTLYLFTIIITVNIPVILTCHHSNHHCLQKKDFNPPFNSTYISIIYFKTLIKFLNHETFFLNETITL